jgi:signal transduction histidine kinase
VDVSALLQQCADAMAPLLGLRRLTLHRSVPPGLRASTAPGRLRSVVTNLLSNAAEYNRPNGTISLFCTAGESELRITVADTGLGIAPEHLPYLFDPFYRGDQARSQDRTAEGGPDEDALRQHLGLGLSLVRAHVQAVNGSISVESRVGEGTVLTITWPVSSCGEESGDAPVHRPATNGPPLQKLASHGGLIETG